MIVRRPARPGVASLALLLIVAITAAWWALALWPAGAAEPAWLLRTRATCFGSVAGGLPDAGGWILLIGEPIGMFGFLLAVWGSAVRDDLRRLLATRRWRVAMPVFALLVLIALALAGRRVAYATGLGAATTPAPRGSTTMVDVDASAFVLTDQTGRRVSLAAYRGRPAVLTFAFGHCTTMCPVIVHDVLAARRETRRADVPLLIVSLDPWRDTPALLPSIATMWELGPDDLLLSGSIDEVERTLDSLGVGRRRDERTGDITHGGTVMLVDSRGHIVRRLDGGWGQVKELLAALPVGAAPR